MASDYATRVSVVDAPTNTHEILLDSSARTATANSDEQTNLNGRGVQVVLNVTAIPATPAGITPKVQSKDPASGTWSDLLSGGSITATGTTVLTVYPGIGVTANESASTVLPKIWRVEVEHADAESYTYSVGANVAV